MRLKTELGAAPVAGGERGGHAYAERRLRDAGNRPRPQFLVIFVLRDQLDVLVDGAIETHASRLTGTRVTVGSVDLDVGAPDGVAANQVGKRVLLRLLERAVQAAVVDELKGRLREELGGSAAAGS